MLRTFHGGHCCGITTIYGFSYNPQSELAITPPRTSADNKGTLLYPENEMPRETAAKRFERLIYLTEQTRGSGIIEVVLTTAQLSYHDHSAAATAERWEDVLKRLGFKLVNSVINSNSGRRINVFHRNSGDLGVPKIEKPYFPPVKGEDAKPATAPLR